MQKIVEQAKVLKDELVQIRREIHQHPEVGRDLPVTREFIMKKLTEYGYEPTLIAGIGIVAYAGGKKPGKTFLLRADMDALPIKEMTDYSFKATNNNMHACGHDMHTTMLLGGAKLLKQYEDEIEGTVKLLFQPDEEGFTGAKSMIKAGVLENPKVDAAMALHVKSAAPSNLIIYGKGTSIASCIRFRITVQGVGCHGAMPETGVDPINIAAHIYLALQEIKNSEIVATEPLVLTVGKFAGGATPNVIPDEVVMEGTIRTYSKEVGATVFQRMGEIAEATAKMFRGSAKLEELSSVPPLTNDSEVAGDIAGYLKEILPPQSIVGIETKGMGSEDFASIAEKVPSVYFIIGAGTKEQDPGFDYPMHHPSVKFDEDILTTGAAAHAYSSIMWLKNHK